MNFRLNDLTNRNSEFDKLLKNTKTFHNTIMSLSGFDGDITVGRVGEDWRVAIEKWHLYEQRRVLKKADMFTSSQDVTDYIELLNTVNRIIKAKEAPEHIKAMLEDIYTGELRIIVLFNESQYIRELFNRRNEIDKDCPLRKRFVTEYIGWEQYRRYDEPILSKMTEEEKDKYDEAYAKSSEEDREKQKQIDNKLLEGLYKEYSEEDLFNWTDNRDYCSKLPEDWISIDKARIEKVEKLFMSSLSEKDKREIEEAELKKEGQGDTPTS